MPARLRPSFVELLHLILATLLAWNLYGATTAPLDCDWIFLVLPPLLITSAVLACRGVFRLFHRRWKTGVRSLVILLFGLGIWYSARTLWHGPLNPWEHYGVRASWNSVGAARQLEANYEVSFQGRPVTGSAGAQVSYDWALRIEDYNHDGVSDVVVQDGRFINALIFIPSANGLPPRFEDIFDELPKE